MKLSPDKIEQLSAALVDQLAEIDGVLFRSDDSRCACRPADHHHELLVGNSSMLRS